MFETTYSEPVDLPELSICRLRWMVRNVCCSAYSLSSRTCLKTMGHSISATGLCLGQQTMRDKFRSGSYLRTFQWVIYNLEMSLTSSCDLSFQRMLKVDLQADGLSLRKYLLQVLDPNRLTDQKLIRIFREMTNVSVTSHGFCCSLTLSGTELMVHCFHRFLWLSFHLGICTQKR